MAVAAGFLIGYARLQQTGARARVTPPRSRSGSRLLQSACCALCCFCCRWLCTRKWCCMGPAVSTSPGQAEEGGRRRGAVTVGSRAQRQLTDFEMTPIQGHSARGSSLARDGSHSNMVIEDEDVAIETVPVPQQSWPRSVSGQAAAAYRRAASSPPKTQAVIHSPPPSNEPLSLLTSPRGSEPANLSIPRTSPQQSPGSPNPGGYLQVPGSQEGGSGHNVAKMSSSLSSAASPQGDTTPAKSSSQEESTSLLDKPSPEHPHSLLKLPVPQEEKQHQQPPHVPGVSDAGPHPPHPQPGQKNFPPIPEIPRSRYQNAPPGSETTRGKHSIPASTTMARGVNVSMRVTPSPSYLADPHSASLSSHPDPGSGQQRPLTSAPVFTGSPAARPRHQERVAGTPTNPEDESLHQLVTSVSEIMQKISQHPDFHAGLKSERFYNEFNYWKVLQVRTSRQSIDFSQGDGHEAEARHPEMCPEPLHSSQPASEERSGGMEASTSPPFPTLMPFRPSSTALPTDSSHSSLESPQSPRLSQSSVAGLPHRTLSHMSPSSQKSLSPQQTPRRASASEPFSPRKRTGFLRRGSKESVGSSSGTVKTRRDDEEEEDPMVMWDPSHPMSAPAGAKYRSDHMDYQEYYDEQARWLRRPRAQSAGDQSSSSSLPFMESRERLRTPANVLYPIEKATHPDDLFKSDSESDERKSGRSGSPSRAGQVRHRSYSAGHRGRRYETSAVSGGASGATASGHHGSAHQRSAAPAHRRHHQEGGEQPKDPHDPLSLRPYLPRN